MQNVPGLLCVPNIGPLSTLLKISAILSNPHHEFADLFNRLYCSSYITHAHTVPRNKPAVMAVVNLDKHISINTFETYLEINELNGFFFFFPERIKSPQ